MPPNMKDGLPDALQISKKLSKDNASSIVEDYAKLNDLQVSEEEKDEVAENISNPNKVLELGKQEQNSQEPQSGTSILTKALIGFLPAVAGAIFGGAEAGAEGAKIGQSALAQLSKEELSSRAQENALIGQRQSLDAKRAEKEADRQFQLYKQEDLFKRKGDIQQQKAENVGKTPLTPFQAQSLYIRKQQADDLRAAEGRRLQSMNNQLDRSKQLSDKQVETLSDVKYAKSALADINLTALSETGPIEGRIRSFGSSLGLSSGVDFDTIKNETGLFFTDFIKSMSGATVSDSERRDLLDLVPKVSDSEDKFVNSLNTFKKRLDRTLKSKVTGIVRGQPLREKAARAFLLPDEVKKEKAAPKEAAPAQDTDLRAKLNRLRELKAKQ